MGTNYYWLNVENECDHCGRGDVVERLHIGKSSGGWCFGLHVHPNQGINDLPDWEVRWASGGHIENEYGERVDPAKMWSVIAEREWNRGGSGDETPFGYASWDEFYRRNHAAPGPNGLVRHRIEPGHCIGHGAGTWDLIVGEFS